MSINIIYYLLYCMVPNIFIKKKKIIIIVWIQINEKLNKNENVDLIYIDKKYRIYGDNNYCPD